MFGRTSSEVRKKFLTPSRPELQRGTNVGGTASVTANVVVLPEGFKFTPIPKDATPHQELAIWMYDHMRLRERS